MKKQAYLFIILSFFLNSLSLSATYSSSLLTNSSFSISLETAKNILDQNSFYRSSGLTAEDIQQKISTLRYGRKSKNDRNRKYIEALNKILDRNLMNFSFPKEEIIIWDVFFGSKKILDIMEIVEEYSKKSKKQLSAKSLRCSLRKRLGFKLYYLFAKGTNKGQETWIYIPRRLRLAPGSIKITKKENSVVAKKPRVEIEKKESKTPIKELPTNKNQENPQDAISLLLALSRIKVGIF